MSGICGVWRRANPAALEGTVAALASGLSLAGEPWRTESDGAAGIGAAARFASQQVYRSARLLLACDAELYNEDELRAEVPGKDPEDVSTAATLAALYERFGCEFVKKLRGGFSVILWDSRERRMMAAIDGFGIKRLVYYEDARGLLVSSRIDSLMRCGEIDSETNPRAIVNILNYSANLAPDTAFTKVRRLLPGHLLTASSGETRIAQYWDMRYGVGNDANEGRLSARLESVVEESVKAHASKESFHELGAFLSGGTDSSTVVGMMARSGQKPIQAFSIGFEEQPFNELGYAELAAKKFQAQHHTYLVGPEDCLRALPQMVRYFDEPFGNSSAIPTYFCARLAAEHGVKAMLAGDGGDELFGGNEWYATDRIFETYGYVPRFIRSRLIEPVLKRLPVEGGLAAKARNYVRRANIPAPQRILSYTFLCAHAPAEVFTSEFLDSLGAYSVLEVPTRYYQEAPAAAHLDRLLYADVKIVLGDKDLPKVGQMCELAGIVPRFPFLDRAVAEFSGSIPAGLKVKGFQKRYLFKRAFRNLLPAEIIQKKKHGFGIPVATWLKSDPRMRELARDTLFSSRARERGYFRRGFIESLFRQHEADDSTYYGDTLWTFLALELWHREFVDVPVKVTA